MRRWCPLVLLTCAAAQAQSNSCRIQTIAGSPTTFSPDGTAALQTRLAYVGGVAVDSAGTVLFSDTSNHRVRKIAADGSIVTMAGTGVPGYSGDGGPAIAAQVHRPGALAFDGAGNLYIADLANYRIRVVSPDGNISTLAGSGGNRDSGDGAPAAEAGFRSVAGLAIGPDGSVFVLDSIAGRVRKIAGGAIAEFAGKGFSSNLPSSDGQPAAQVQLHGPQAIAADSKGNLYIAENRGADGFSAPVIRRVTPDGTIGVIAGAGSAKGDGGSALAAEIAASSLTTDAAGNLYLFDGTNAIRMIDAAGIIHHISKLSGATAIAASAGGVIASTNGTLQLLAPVDSAIRLAGIPDAGFGGDSGPALSAALSTSPQGIAFGPSGELYFSDSSNFRVRKIDSRGIVTTVAGIDPPPGGDGSPVQVSDTGDGGPAINAMLAVPAGVAVDTKGNVYIADRLGRVRMMNTQGIISTFAGGGSSVLTGPPVAATSVRLPQPYQVSVDRAGNLYVLDAAHLVKKVSTTDHTVTVVTGGTARKPFPSSINGLSGSDLAMTVDPSDNLFIVYATDSGAKAAVVKIAPSGAATAIGWIPSVPNDANSIAVDADGNIYIGDITSIHKFSPDGTMLTITGSYTGVDMLQDGPASQAVEGAQALAVGSDGSLYVADGWYGRIRRITAAGCAGVRQPVIGAVVNAASLREGTAAPGEIVSLFGVSLGPSAGVGGQFDDSGKLASALSGVSVLFNGKPVPLYYAAAAQINAQVPASAASSYTMDVRVQYQGLVGDATVVTVAGASPGIFGGVSSKGRVAALINADGTINSAENPAERRSIVSLFATGGGLTGSPVADGAPAPGASSLLLPSGVAVNDAAAQVLYAGSAPGYVGVTQVNFQIPDDPKVVSGFNTLLLSVGDPSNSDTSGLFVK